jgi:hypothetical protein
MNENCKKGWDRKFLKDNFSDKFINGPYKKHRENVMCDHQISKLTSTVPYAESTKRLKKIKEMHKAVQKQMDAFRHRKGGHEIFNFTVKREVFRELHYASHMLHNLMDIEKRFLDGRCNDPFDRVRLTCCMHNFEHDTIEYEDMQLYDSFFLKSLFEETSKTLLHFGDRENFDLSTQVHTKEVQAKQPPKPVNYNSRGKCSYSDCDQGLVGKGWLCVTCERKTCQHCMEPIEVEKNMVEQFTGTTLSSEKDEQGREIIVTELRVKQENDKVISYLHKCNNDIIQSVKTVRETSKPCPNCRARVDKISGCDQMWCTCCHTAFSWNTGKTIKVTFFHNPHYTEYLRNQREQAAPVAPRYGVGSHIRGSRYRDRHGQVHLLFDEHDNRIVFCGRQVNHRLILAAGSYYGFPETMKDAELLDKLTDKLNMINEFRENIQSKSVSLQANRRARRPEYGRPVLATDYLTNKLHEECEALRIDFLLKKFDKKEFARALQICEKRYKKSVDILQVKTTNLEIVLDFIATLINGQCNLEQCTTNIERAENMSKQAIMQVGKWYGHKNTPCTESLYKYLSISKTKPQARKRKTRA